MNRQDTRTWLHVRGRVVAPIDAYVLHSEDKLVASRYPDFELEVGAETVRVSVDANTIFPQGTSYHGPFEHSGDDAPLAMDDLVEMEGKEGAMALAPLGQSVELRTMRVRVDTMLDVWGVVTEVKPDANAYRTVRTEVVTVFRAACCHVERRGAPWWESIEWLWSGGFWFLLVPMWGVLTGMAVAFDPAAIVAFAAPAVFALLHFALRQFEPEGLHNPWLDRLIVVSAVPLLDCACRVGLRNHAILASLLFALAPIASLVASLIRRRDQSMLTHLASRADEEGLLVRSQPTLAGFGKTSLFEAPRDARLVGRNWFFPLLMYPSRFLFANHRGSKVLFAASLGRDPRQEIRWALRARRALLVASVCFAVLQFTAAFVAAPSAGWPHRESVGDGDD